MQLSPITATTNIAGVIGDPIAHSLSPILHNTWLAQANMDGVYIPLHVKEEDVTQTLRLFPKLGIKGCNVTIPHKEKVLQVVDEVEDVAAAIGAVNTVIVEREKLLGFNTDAYGFWQNIAPMMSHKEQTLSHPVILGAGGAARAVVYALEKESANQIHVVARNPEKAQALADISDNIVIHAFSDFRAAISHASLLINTTPLGMKGKDAFEWDLEGLSKDALVTDIVYNPIQTQLLKKAAGRGNTTVDGLGMLIHQALPGFEAWYGIRPDISDMKHLKQELIQQCKLSH